ncbi:MAG: hypothetical protein Q8J68_02515 [Methanolobus sp.]|uniref:hypothetical protein n=1 Tax=Methanolobus sp. TaxID=1874737 RepID=UPI00272FF6DE|nr:hypothetical protein [Methanolobus sp.]MDP2216148.1 hypothetical protein [Methanolobus sp.]
MVLLFMVASVAVIFLFMGMVIAFVFRQQAKVNSRFPPGRWRGIWIGIGLIFGVLLGMVLAVAFDSRALVGMGPAIGAGLGLAAGHIFEKMYGMDATPLTPEEARHRKISFIIVSLFVLIGLLLALLSVL